MAVNIDMVADVKDVIRGTDSIADALDEVADSLTDLADKSTRETSKAGDDLGDSFKDGAKDANRALDTVGDGLSGTARDAKAMDDKVSDAFRNMAKDARKAGDTVGKESKDGFKKGGEATAEFKDEAKANLSEVTSSFSGDMDSAVDLIQGTLGGLVGSLGPVGLLGGALAAVGIGLAKAFADADAERINAIGEEVSQLATEIRTAGGDLAQVDFGPRMEEWGLAIQDTKEWWELFQDSAKTGLDVIKERADKAGVGWVDAFKGTKGTMEDAKAALADVDDKLKEATDSARYYTDAINGTAYMDPDDQKRIDALKELKKGYEDNISTQQRAADATAALEAAGVKTTDQIQAEKDAVEHANDALLAHRDALDAASGAAISADKAELDYVTTMSSGAADIEKNGRSIDIHTAAGQANRQTLIDMAGSAKTLIAAQIEQGDSTAAVTGRTQQARDAFIAAAEKAGFNATAAKKLADQYGLIPKNVATQVKAHGVEQTKREIDGVAAPRTATVNVQRGEDRVSPYINSLNGRTIWVNIAGRGGNQVMD